MLRGLNSATTAEQWKILACEDRARIKLIKNVVALEERLVTLAGKAQRTGRLAGFNLSEIINVSTFCH
jgi:hypothetical protein